MQPTVQQEDRPAGLNDVAAILDHDSSRVMLEPPDLHADLADRAPSLAAEIPPPDPALRATHLNDNVATAPRPRASLLRGVVHAFVAVAIGAAATVGWLSYGEAAREMIATWTPQFVATGPAQAQDVKVADQPAAAAKASVEQPVPAQPVSAVAAVAAPAPAAEIAAPPQAVAAAGEAAAAPDLAPRIEEMAREIASLRETVAQLKSGQQQLSRDLAKAVEQEPRRKSATAATPAPAPRPVAAAPRSNPPPSQPAYASPQPAYTPPQPSYAPPPQRQVYVAPPYVPPPQVHTPRVYVPPPHYYDDAPRPPRPLP